nr:TIGR04222 domain-containing membrane protein [Pirellula sp.]
MNPLELDGPDFLKLFSISIVAASVLTMVYRSLLSSAESNRDVSKLPRLNSWQIAYLRGGPQAVSQTAIIDLAAKKLIVGDPKSERFVPSTNASTSIDHVRMDPIPNALYRAVQMGEGMKTERVTDAVRYECDKIKQSLIEMGVLQSIGQRVGLAWPGILAFGAVLVLGGAKLFVGVSRGKPVDYLLLLFFSAIGLGIALNYSKRLTGLGKLVWEREIRKHHAATSISQSEEAALPPVSFADNVHLYTLHPLAIGFAAKAFSSMDNDGLIDAYTLTLAQRILPYRNSSGKAENGGCGRDRTHGRGHDHPDPPPHPRT